jgi:hypothetical protein
MEKIMKYLNISGLHRKKKNCWIDIDGVKFTFAQFNKAVKEMDALLNAPNIYAISQSLLGTDGNVFFIWDSIYPATYLSSNTTIYPGDKYIPCECPVNILQFSGSYIPISLLPLTEEQKKILRLIKTLSKIELTHIYVSSKFEVTNAQIKKEKSEQEIINQ